MIGLWLDRLESNHIIDIFEKGGTRTLTIRGRKGLIECLYFIHLVDMFQNKYDKWSGHRYRCMDYGF